MLVVLRRLGAIALGLGLVAVGPTTPARASVAVVVVDGHGRGHGVGMAQDGAYWMGQGGASTDQILEHFFPGTKKSTTTGVVRVVALVTADNRAVVTFPQGGELRSPRSGPQRAGFPVRIAPGGAATVSFDGSYRVEPAGGAVVAAQVGPAQPIPLPSTSSTTTTTLLPAVSPPTTSKPAPPTTQAPSTTTTTTAPGAAPPTTQAPPPPITSPEPVWAGAANGGTVGLPARGFVYRGELEVSAGTGPLRVVNEVDIEQYLWGLGEVSAAWSPAALGAQMVAARTYALRAMAANGEICDTQRCQVYKGASGEFRGQIDAARATAGQFLGFAGTRYASTVFSANGAGVTATPEEGFGTPNSVHPYLTAAPYETKSEVTWQVRIALVDLAHRLGYPGNATSIRVASKGASGRPLAVELDGDHGRLVRPALQAASAMGLPSTFWGLHVEASDAAPPPPVAADRIQAAPDNVGAVIAQETQAAIRHRPHATTTTLAAARQPRRDEGHGTVPWLLVLLVLAAGATGVAVLRRAQSA